MKKQIKNYIVNSFMPEMESIGDDDSLFEAGALDSLRFLELLAFIEKTFGVSLHMSEITIEKFDSLNKICALIKEKQDIKLK